MDNLGFTNKDLNEDAESDTTIDDFFVKDQSEKKQPEDAQVANSKIAPMTNKNSDSAPTLATASTPIALKDPSDPSSMENSKMTSPPVSTTTNNDKHTAPNQPIGGFKDPNAATASPVCAQPESTAKSPNDAVDRDQEKPIGGFKDPNAATASPTCAQPESTAKSPNDAVDRDQEKPIGGFKDPNAATASPACAQPESTAKSPNDAVDRDQEIDAMKNQQDVNNATKNQEDSPRQLLKLAPRQTVDVSPTYHPKPPPKPPQVNRPKSPPKPPQLKEAPRTKSTNGTKKSEESDTKKKTSLLTQTPKYNTKTYKLQDIGARVVGCIQDQAFADQTPACSCSRDSGRQMKTGQAPACLKLYCPCFANGSYCTERCACSASCANHVGAQETRTQAISEALYNDSNCFRETAMKVCEVQRYTRAALQRGEEPDCIIGRGATDPDQFDQDPCKFIRKSLLTTQLPPSYHTVPFKGSSGEIHRSLCFSLTHPKSRRAKRKRSKVAPPVVIPGDPAKNIARRKIIMSPTELQEKVKHTDSVIDEYFKSIYAESRVPESATAVVKSDVRAVQAAMEAAETEASALFFKDGELQEQILKDYGCPVGPAQKAPPCEEDGQHLYCEETLEPAETETPALEGPDMKASIIGIAQDTALLRETAKSIRRITRELCALRTKALDPRGSF